ncbi:2717_t:CDS:2 [Acaulospora colombiana]|uniref:2717_t:CDS:1 n=1 Tax=Acaulospora colombiana TaxID=27376 RepID=A0ACA9PFK7_9GLOM|nr:2717_t:CDS:2 [Acaulospora colombiana]
MLSLGSSTAVSEWDSDATFFSIQRSYTWSRVCHFLWPFIIVICGVRAIFMIWELNRGRDKIIWECQNGGQHWGDTPEVGYSSTVKFPSGICGPGFQTLLTAFIVSLLVDLGFQRYTTMKGPYGEDCHVVTLSGVQHQCRDVTQFKAWAMTATDFLLHCRKRLNPDYGATLRIYWIAFG